MKSRIDFSIGEDRMAGINRNKIAWHRHLVKIGITVLVLSACATTPESSRHVSSMATRGSEQVFATPQQAADALVEATRHYNKDALLKILGPNSSMITSSGDPVADRISRNKFIAAYDSSHKFESEGDDEEFLIIGKEEWPLPIPLVRINDNGWKFDTESGVQEILNRRIGHNEINVIETCRAYVEAQREYATQHRLPNGKPEYAQHIVSTKGKHDGLYWSTKAGEQDSPLGPLIANARTEGYAVGEKPHMRQPFHGYYYKMLKREGPSTVGGAKDYIVDGHMTGGFALIAFPARYGDSGIMTFIVNQDGIVYQKNLGPETAESGAQITQYDPDESWKIVADQ
jgi:hypothetical protein